MALTTAGATLAMQGLIGEAATYANAANGYLGVGDSSTAFSAAHTDLQASSNKVRKPMDPSYPSRSGLAVTVRALFGTSDANFAWQEWGWFNASTAGTMISRKVESLGTKSNTQSWQLTATLTGAAA
jgi:hypothetical protein